MAQRARCFNHAKFRASLLRAGIARRLRNGIAPQSTEREPLSIHLATAVISAKFKTHYQEKVAEKIANAEQLMNYNQEAFQQLAVAQVPVKVVRTESYGVMNPRKFALVIEGADSAEIRRVEGQDNGFIFFTSNLSERQRVGSNTNSPLPFLPDNAPFAISGI